MSSNAFRMAVNEDALKEEMLMLRDKLANEAAVPPIGLTPDEQERYEATINRMQERLAELEAIDWALWRQANTLSNQRASLPAVTVEYRGKVFDFRLGAAGATDKGAGLTPGMTWDGYLTLALYTAPANPQELKNVLEALAAQGFQGLMVGRIPTAADEGALPVRFFQFDMVYALTAADLEKFGNDIIAKVEIAYRTQRDTFEGRAVSAGDRWQIQGADGEPL